MFIVKLCVEYTLVSAAELKCEADPRKVQSDGHLPLSGSHLYLLWATHAQQ